MKEKRRRLLRLSPLGRFKFVNFILVLVIVFAFINAFTSIKLLEEKKIILGGEVLYFASQFAFVAIGLIFIATLSYILHYGFGAVSRMEKIADEIIKGNYSLRMHLRKKDIMRPFAEKLNKILDLLEKK